MHRPNLERSVTAAIFWLLVASVLFVGTIPASAQSKSNGQGIPQQIADLQRRVEGLEQSSGLAPGGSGSGPVLRVVDANGTEVGLMIAPGQAARKVGESWLLLNVQPEGFTDYPPTLYNDRADCQGTAYMYDYRAGLLKPVAALKGVIYYAGAAPRSVTVAALQTYLPTGNFMCEAYASPVSGTLSEVTTVDLSGLVPPFAVRYE